MERKKITKANDFAEIFVVKLLLTTILSALLANFSFAAVCWTYPDEMEFTSGENPSEILLNGVSAHVNKFRFVQVLGLDKNSHLIVDLEKIPFTCGVINSTDDDLLIKKISMIVHYSDNESQNGNKTLRVTRSCEKDCDLGNSIFKSTVASSDIDIKTALFEDIKLKKEFANRKSYPYCADLDFDLDQRTAQYKKAMQQKITHIECVVTAVKN
ncbi:MAG: hypothetical protein H6625_07420 [Bdellovibrionaceae bacterium]|nr:hypothetical protein [Pseudobdellovibrionaceae bacterium]